MEPDNNELDYYTTLGKLGPTELGLDAEGDVMALASGPEGLPVVLVIRAGTGGFQVHNITEVPMDWPVTKCKLMMAAVPISKADSDARDAARDAEREADERDDLDADCDDELGDQIATERG